MEISPRIAGVELGGTKSIAVITEGKRILDEVTVPTTTPEETLGRLRDWLEARNAEAIFQAMGIASFGPLQLDVGRPDYGCMLKTPKPNWTGAAIVRELASPFACPHVLDTDVNGAALAEYLWGAGADCTSFCYITIGTGLGGGFIINGRPLHGAMHPEIGHLRLRRADGDTFPGACPFHGDCIEGLVSGPALTARFGAAAGSVPDEHPVWEHVSSDVAELASAILLTTSAERILFGGGVSVSRSFLLPMVRRGVVDRLGGYLPFVRTETIDQIIRLPGLGGKAGPLGAVALALTTLDS